MPQFIVLTVDDALTGVAEAAIGRATQATNLNGCGIPATWFISVEYTQVEFVRPLFLAGHEIATHTLTHVALGDAEEIGGAATWLSTNAGIPRRAVNGFRAPFLKYNRRMRRDLRRLGFRYDSSITELFHPTSGTSPSESERLFPYTMDFGIPQDCSTGTCEASERHEGLWELPLWVFQNDRGGAVAALDPPTHAESAYELFKREFDRNYHGARTPVGLNFHAAFFIGEANEARVDDMNRFLAYALSHEHVYAVTVNQLLDYLADPIPAAQFAEYFTRDVQCPPGGYLPRYWGLDMQFPELTPDPPSESGADQGPDAGADGTDEDGRDEVETTPAPHDSPDSVPRVPEEAADTSAPPAPSPSPASGESEDEGRRPSDATVHPCGPSCRHCIADPTSTRVSSDSACAPCQGAEPYQYWPCNQAGLCVCADPANPSSDQPASPAQDPVATTATTAGAGGETVATETPAPVEAFCATVGELTGGCSLLVAGNVKVGGGFVAGKLCAGGDFQAGSFFSAGAASSPAACSGDPFAVVVGGDVEWELGTVHRGAHCVGGAAGEPSVLAAAPDCGESHDGDPGRCAALVDFDGSFRRLIALSSHLAAAAPPGFQLSAVGAESTESGVLAVRVDAAHRRHAVSLDARALLGWEVWAIEVSVRAGEARDVELVVISFIHVPAAGLPLRKTFLVPAALRGRVLWNYPSDRPISIEHGVTLHGSLLAPRAVLAGNSAGTVNGRLVVASFAADAAGQTLIVDGTDSEGEAGMCVGDAGELNLLEGAAGKQADGVEAAGSRGAPPVVPLALALGGVALVLAVGAFAVARRQAWGGGGGRSESRRDAAAELSFEALQRQRAPAADSDGPTGKDLEAEGGGGAAGCRPEPRERGRGSVRPSLTSLSLAAAHGLRRVSHLTVAAAGRTPSQGRRVTLAQPEPSAPSPLMRDAEGLSPSV